MNFEGSLMRDRRKKIKQDDLKNTAPYFEELGYDKEVQEKILDMLVPVNFCKLAKLRGWSNKELRERFKLDEI